MLALIRFFLIGVIFSGIISCSNKYEVKASLPINENIQTSLNAEHIKYRADAIDNFVSLRYKTELDKLSVKKVVTTCYATYTLVYPPEKTSLRRAYLIERSNGDIFIYSQFDEDTTEEMISNIKKVNYDKNPNIFLVNPKAFFGSTKSSFNALIYRESNIADRDNQCIDLLFKNDNKLSLFFDKDEALLMQGMSLNGFKNRISHAIAVTKMIINDFDDAEKRKNQTKDSWSRGF